jgi:hypothetical protein
LARSTRLFSNGPSSMMYELLQNCFVPNDCASGFDLFFEVFGHIVQGHVPPSVSFLFFTYQLLTLEKQSRNIYPIMINDVTYCLVVHTLAI